MPGSLRALEPVATPLLADEDSEGGVVGRRRLPAAGADGGSHGVVSLVAVLSELAQLFGVEREFDVVLVFDSDRVAADFLDGAVALGRRDNAHTAGETVRHGCFVRTNTGDRGALWPFPRSSTCHGSSIGLWLVQYINSFMVICQSSLFREAIPSKLEADEYELASRGNKRRRAKSG